MKVIESNGHSSKRYGWGCKLGLLAVALAVGWVQAADVLVECEGFRDQGGWVLDQQFMDQMGSPFLLAHGLGTPVQDAVTTVRVPEPGDYRIWVRTRDWVGTWKTPDTPAALKATGTPGEFEVLVNGQALPVKFGAEGAAWHWQDGGKVRLEGKEITLALHDLQGFDGRCDAILLTTDDKLVPPNDGTRMTEFRRRLLGLSAQPEEAGEFDLVVVGGGLAGTCAAVSAARLGSTVALIQDRPVLGGNNSSEVRVWLQGNVGLPPYPRVGDVVKEFDPKHRAHPGTAAMYEDDQRIARVQSEKNISLFLGWRANRVDVESGSVRAVIAQNTRTGQTKRFAAKLVADCTGDGAIGVLAGAEHTVRTTDHMGPSNLWSVRDTKAPSAFPRCPWALNLADKPFPGRGAKTAQVAGKKLADLGQWFWECGFNWDPLKDREKMRDWNLRAAFGAWDTLKNVDGLYPNHRLDWMAYISGLRESVQLLGEVVLDAKAIKENRVWEDGCFPCTWSIDVHRPAPRYAKGFEGNEFISVADFGEFKRPYWAPYRCLYSRNIANLFMAGRDISVTHEALGTVRVMRTGGMMGEIVGMAASICRKHNTTPHAVYEQHLDELKALMQQGVGRADQAPAREEKK